MFSNAENHFRTFEYDHFYKIIDTLSYEQLYGAAILETDIYNTDPRIFDYATGNNYEVGGNYMDVYSRKSIVNTFKTDLTSQLNRYHQIKLGVEYRKTSITYNNLTVLQASYTQFEPVVRSQRIMKSMIHFNPWLIPLLMMLLMVAILLSFLLIYKIKLRKRI